MGGNDNADSHSLKFQKRNYNSQITLIVISNVCLPDGLVCEKSKETKERFLNRFAHFEMTVSASVPRKQYSIGR